jgi:hypothetical protein
MNEAITQVQKKWNSVTVLRKFDKLRTGRRQLLNITVNITALRRIGPACYLSALEPRFDHSTVRPRRQD